MRTSGRKVGTGHLGRSSEVRAGLGACCRRLRLSVKAEPLLRGSFYDGRLTASSLVKVYLLDSWVLLDVCCFLLCSGMRLGRAMLTLNCQASVCLVDD
jgi:hypothetical protein